MINNFIENSKIVTNKEILDFEHKYDIKLPAPYRDFLLNIGSGELNDNYCYVNLDLNYYDVNSFIGLNDLLEENKFMDNQINKSNLLIIAGTLSYSAYSIYIHEKSEDYGKIYYYKSGFHPPFEYFKDKRIKYTEYELLEDSFDKFINKIMFVED